MKEKMKTWLAEPKSKCILAIDGAILLFSAIAIVLRLLFMFPTVSGNSMEPTLSNGSVICVSKVAEVKEGDVCLFWSNDLGEYVVKRVVAVGECDIKITPEGLFKDGVLVAEGYVSDRDWAVDVESQEWHVEKGEYFVLGDNRLHSQDSRSFGPMTEEEFVGVMLGRVV